MTTPTGPAPLSAEEIAKLRAHEGSRHRRAEADRPGVVVGIPVHRRILELSTTCLPSEAFQVAAEARAYLFERGVDVIGEHQTKTATALEFFSSELRAS